MVSSPFNATFHSKVTLRFALALMLGFVSGFPYAAVESTLQAWLTESGASLEHISQFAYVLLPYSLKFLWAPFLDQLAPPLLGRRKGWAVIAQIALTLSFTGMAFCDPHQHLWSVAILATCAAFCSASLDISLDAQRRELFADTQLGLASTLFTNGYRIGLIASGGLALALAEFWAWWEVYLTIAVISAVCIVVVVLSEEPSSESKRPVRNFSAMVTEPFIEFFSRRGWMVLLLFVVTYKLGDSLAAALRTTFLLNVGYSKIQIAEISKAVGLAASIAGAFAGGVLMLRMSLIRSLVVFGILQAVSTLGFWFVARTTPDLGLLTVVIGFENFTGGLGTSAYVAFIASICDLRFSGTQYAALTSLMRIPSIVASAQTGRLVNLLGWAHFFLLCVVAAAPAFLLIPFIQKRQGGCSIK